MTDEELQTLIVRAQIAYSALTPEQKTQMHGGQRRSWVIGQLMLSNPGMSRQRAEELYDRRRG